MIFAFLKTARAHRMARTFREVSGRYALAPKQLNLEPQPVQIWASEMVLEGQEGTKTVHLVLLSNLIIYYILYVIFPCTLALVRQHFGADLLSKLIK